MTVAVREYDEFELYDIYNPSYRHGGLVNVTYKGQWTPVTGLNDVLTQYKYKRRQNFNLLALNFSLVVRRLFIKYIIIQLFFTDKKYYDNSC